MSNASKVIDQTDTDTHRHYKNITSMGGNKEQNESYPTG